MQVAEVKTSSAAKHHIQAKRQPFFSKEGQDNFFSHSNEATSTFFNSPFVQTKLTIGQPNDKYEVEADAMANKVVQKLSSSDTAIQPKCDSCEEEERIQEKTEDTSGEGLEVQTKPIFESDAEIGEQAVQRKPLNGSMIQPKCEACEQEEQVQKKEEDEPMEEDLQKKALDDLTIGEPNDAYEKEADAAADQVVQKLTESEVPTINGAGISAEGLPQITSISNTPLQSKCEDCEKEELEEQPNEGELQRKEKASTLADPLDDEPNVQRRSLEMERTEYPILFKKVPNIQRSSRGGSGSGTREQIVEEAQKMVGKIEAKKDDGSGRRVGAEHLLEIFHLAAGDAWSDEVIENVRYTDEFPHWCGIFSVYAIKKAGIDLGFWQVGMGVSSYGTLQPTDNPQPGDIGYFTELQHHCIIKAVNGDTIDSIDGNSGNFSEVIERTRPRSQFHAFFTPYTGSEKIVQKKEEAQTENTSGTGLSDKLRSNVGKGNTMDDSTRSQMESGFGADFSDVRIHTNGEAVQMNKDLNAQAFTHGSDIYFNEGKYNPSTTSGKHLLAHELTHTMQQGAIPNVTPKIQKNGSGYEEQEQQLNSLFSAIMDEKLPAFNGAVDSHNRREAGLNGRRILFLWSEIQGIVRSIATQEINASEEFQESRMSELLPDSIKLSYDHTKSSILTRFSTQVYKGSSVLDLELVESEYENTVLDFISHQIARVTWVIRDLNSAIELLNNENLELEQQWTFIGLIRQHQNPFDFGYMYKVLEDANLLNRISSFSDAPSLAWEIINRSQLQIRASVPLDPGQELGLFRLKPVESKIELLQPLTPKEISQRIYRRRLSWRELLHPYNRSQIGDNNGDTLLHAGTELRIIPALIADDQIQWIFMSVQSALAKEEEEGTSPYLRQTTNHTPVVGNDVTFQLYWPPNGFPNHNIQWAFQNDPIINPSSTRVLGPRGFIHWEENNSNDTWELRASYPGIHQIFATLTPRHGSGSRELSIEQVVLSSEEQTEIAFTQASGVNVQSPQEFLESLRERKRNASSASEREEIEARIQEIETSLEEDTRHPLSGRRTLLRPLQAVFVSSEDQPLSVPLRIFIGSDPDWFAADTRGYHMKIWDYTLQESTTWTGEHDDRMQKAAKDAIQSFADYAPYPDGILRVKVPDYGRYDRQEILTLETGGGRALMDFIRALSMISLAVGVGSAFLGQPEIAIPAFALASALGGAAGSFNIATRLEHGNFEWDLETGMDILDVAGAVMTFGASTAVTTTVRGVGRVTFMGRMSQAIDATQIVVMSGMHVAQRGAAVASGDRDRVVNALLSALADGALFLIIHRAGRRLQRGGAGIDEPSMRQLEGNMQDASSIIRADGTITIGGESHGMSMVIVDGQIIIRICSPNCSQLARALGRAIELPEVMNDPVLRNKLETLELEASRLESRVNNVEEDFTFEDAQPRVNEMLDELRAIGRDHPNLVDAIFNRSGMPEPEAHLEGHGSMFRAIEEGGAHQSESIRYVEAPNGDIRAIDASLIPDTLRTGQSFDIDGQTYKYLGDIEQRLLIDEGFSARDLARTGMRTRIQESHDRGVELGRAEALREGIVLTPFDPPDQYLGLFGKGIDDLGRRGNVFYILEWKGGSSRLGSGQMTDAWVGRKLAELAIYNDPRAQQLLTAALDGRLKGRGYRTQRADDGTWETTRMEEGPLQGGEIVYDGDRVRSAYDRRLAQLRERYGIDADGNTIQPKLENRYQGNRFEKEADSIANHVMQRISIYPTNTNSSTVQRSCTKCENLNESAIETDQLAEAHTETVQRAALLGPVVVWGGRYLAKKLVQWGIEEMMEDEGDLLNLSAAAIKAIKAVHIDFMGLTKFNPPMILAKHIQMFAYMEDWCLKNKFMAPYLWKKYHKEMTEGPELNIKYGKMGRRDKVRIRYHIASNTYEMKPHFFEIKHSAFNTEKRKQTTYIGLGIDKATSDIYGGMAFLPKGMLPSAVSKTSMRFLMDEDTLTKLVYGDAYQKDKYTKVTFVNEVHKGKLELKLAGLCDIGGGQQLQGIFISWDDIHVWDGQVNLDVKGLSDAEVPLSRDPLSELMGKLDGINLEKDWNFNGIAVKLKASYLNGVLEIRGTGKYKPKKDEKSRIKEAEITLLATSKEKAWDEVKKQLPERESAESLDLYTLDESAKELTLVGWGSASMSIVKDEKGKDVVTGQAGIVVDPDNHITVFGTIRVESRYTLMNAKGIDWKPVTDKLEFMTFIPIPEAGGTIRFTGEGGLEYKYVLGPITLYDIHVDGIYSTNPSIHKELSITGRLNISTELEGRIVVTGRAAARAGLPIDWTGIDVVAIQARVEGIGSLKGYTDLETTFGKREQKTEDGKILRDFIKGTLEIGGELALKLKGTLAFEILYGTAKEESIEGEWPIANAGVAIDFDYNLGDEFSKERLGEIFKLRKEKFNRKRFIKGVIRNKHPKGSEQELKGGFKDEKGKKIGDVSDKPPELPEKVTPVKIKDDFNMNGVWHYLEVEIGAPGEEVKLKMATTPELLLEKIKDHRKATELLLSKTEDNQEKKRLKQMLEDLKDLRSSTVKVIQTLSRLGIDPEESTDKSKLPGFEELGDQISTFGRRYGISDLGDILSGDPDVEPSSDIGDGSYDYPIKVRWAKRSWHTPISLSPKIKSWTSRGKKAPPQEDTYADMLGSTEIEVAPTQYLHGKSKGKGKKTFPGQKNKIRPIDGEDIVVVTIGVKEHLKPDIGKRIKRVGSKSRRKGMEGKFKTLLRNYSYDWSDMSPDHVQDLGWSGKDEIENLWPLERGLNKEIANQIYHQDVKYIEDGVIKIGKPLYLIGKWFIIESWGDFKKKE